MEVVYIPIIISASTTTESYNPLRLIKSNQIPKEKQSFCNEDKKRLKTILRYYSSTWETTICNYIVPKI